MFENEKAANLKALFRKIQTDPNYRNERMGTVFVSGRGSMEKNPIVLVGEAPGREEERQGAPFVGLAGRNLDIILKRAGLSRDQVFITNLIKYRPITLSGSNRSPTISEGRQALPYLLDELKILRPRLVVCLGLSSARILLQDTCLKMSTANGRFFGIHGLRILVTYHPSPFNFAITQKREAIFHAFKRVCECDSASLTMPMQLST